MYYLIYIDPDTNQLIFVSDWGDTMIFEFADKREAEMLWEKMHHIFPDVDYKIVKCHTLP